MDGLQFLSFANLCGMYFSVIGCLEHSMAGDMEPNGTLIATDRLVI